MEQLAPPIFAFSAFVRGKDGSLNDFNVDIFNPRDSGLGDSVCTVSCPLLRTKPVEIYGVDHEQAFQLAHRYIEINLDAGALALVDREGVPVTFPKCPPFCPT